MSNLLVGKTSFNLARDLLCTLDWFDHLILRSRAASTVSEGPEGANAANETHNLVCTTSKSAHIGGEFVEAPPGL